MGFFDKLFGSGNPEGQSENSVFQLRVQDNPPQDDPLEAIFKATEEIVGPLWARISPLKPRYLSQLAMMLDQGHDPNARLRNNEMAETPLIGLCKQLPYCEDDPTKMYSVDYATLLDAVALFLRHGANPNLSDGDGFVPLTYACKFCCPQAVQLLVNFGADPNFKSHALTEGPAIQSQSAVALLFTCLHYLLTNLCPDWERMSDILRILGKAGADPGYVDQNGNTIADFALAISHRWKGQEVTKLLLWLRSVMAASWKTEVYGEGIGDLIDSSLSHIASQLKRHPTWETEVNDFIQGLVSEGIKSEAVHLMLATALLSIAAHIDGEPTERQEAHFRCLLQDESIGIKTRSVLNCVFTMGYVADKDFGSYTNAFRFYLTCLTDIYGADSGQTKIAAALVVQMLHADGSPSGDAKELLDFLLLAISGEGSNTDREQHKRGNESDTQGSSKLYYDILKCSESDTDEFIRQRHRELVKDYHPDVLQGKHLPKEFLDLGRVKFQEIQEAYEKIKE